MVISLYQPLSFCQIGQRTNQEDCRLPDADSPSEVPFFFAVCDGVGGCDDGEVASRSVCEGFKDALEGTDWSEPFTVDDFQQALTEAYERLDDVAKGAGNKDMATTLGFICFHGDGCLVAHIGDSRIYQIRPETGIVYRSSDHSQVNNLIHAGVISPDQSESSPDRSVISRYMEPSSNEAPRCMATVLQTRDIRPDDYFFLCTDGVLECVDDETLCRIICLQASDEEKCGEIAALCQRSHDNNTAYLLHVAAVDTTNDDMEQEDVEIHDDTPYTEHQTVVGHRHLSHTVDVEPDEPDTPMMGGILNFIKKIFH